jgi:Spy/CpxP family protein refolding chaperone
MLAKKLGLTDEQKAKIIALDKEMMADMKANKDVEEKNKKERFEKRMKKQKEMDKKMKEILTAEQYAEYQNMKPKMGRHHGHRPGMKPAMFDGGQPGFPPHQE